jgi:hypothetical protein
MDLVIILKLFLSENKPFFMHSMKCVAHSFCIFSSHCGSDSIIIGNRSSLAFGHLMYFSKHYITYTQARISHKVTYTYFLDFKSLFEHEHTTLHVVKVILRTPFFYFLRSLHSNIKLDHFLISSPLSIQTQRGVYLKSLLKCMHMTLSTYLLLSLNKFLLTDGIIIEYIKQFVHVYYKIILFI